MVHRYPRPSLRLAVCASLTACNIDNLADEFYVKEPTYSTGEASSSSGVVDPDSSSTGTSSTGPDTAADTSTADTSTGAVDTTDPPDPSTSTDTTATSTDGPTPVCGDGVIDPPEECEDPGDIHCFNCYRDRYVFVTSMSFQGDFAAETGNLDYWCSYLAAVAGLQPDLVFHFKPWISTSTASAADRLHHSPGRYLLTNDLVFAESWDDIVAGNILNPLTVDENSQTNVTEVWTDTLPDGTATLPENGNHCNDWTDDGFDSWAYYGFSDAVDANWTLYDDMVVNPDLCGGKAALYCFQSPEPVPTPTKDPR